MEDQVGACGVSCAHCEVYKRKEYRCFGCDWANRMLRKSRENEKGCTFWECTQEKEVECCFSCEEFPCQTHYNPEEAVYTRQILDTWEELRRTGLTFWGRKKELQSLLKADEEEGSR